MTTTTAAVPAGRPQIVPALIVGVLAVAGLGCLTAAAIQLVTTAGPVLLAAPAAVAVAGLVKTLSAAAGALPWLACLALALAVGPLAGALAAGWVLARRIGGEPDA